MAVSLEGADALHRQDEVDDEATTPAVVRLGANSPDFVLSLYQCDWRDVEFAFLRVYGPVSPATHWVAEGEAADRGMKVSLEVTAAAFQMVVAADSPDPAQFSAYESYEVSITGGALYDCFDELAGSRAYFAGSRTQRRPRYNCEDFAKELVSNFVTREEPEDDFM
eukprot:gene19076-6395_t